MPPRKNNIPPNRSRSITLTALQPNRTHRVVLHNVRCQAREYNITPTPGMLSAPFQGMAEAHGAAVTVTLSDNATAVCQPRTHCRQTEKENRYRRSATVRRHAGIVTKPTPQ
jgi:hypothetical protein